MQATKTGDGGRVASTRPGRGGPKDRAAPGAGCRRIGAVVLVSLAVAGTSIALQSFVGNRGGLYAPTRSWGPAAPIAAQVSLAEGHQDNRVALPRPEVWVVRPGDTIWSIAEQAGAAGDPRPLVDWLSAEVGGQPLQVGERLVLPPSVP